MSAARTFLALLLLLNVGACSKTADTDLYQNWLHTGNHRAEVAALGRYLARQDVGAILPMDQLLRSDVKWRACKDAPFTVPPQSRWPNIVPTLRLLRDEVIPLIGQVTVQSAYRGANINHCIKGASRSFHLSFHALDLRPATKMSRMELIERLCKLHREKGAALQMGLGIYRGTRFHIDAAGYRGWGQNYRSNSFPCTSFVALQRNIR